MIDAFGDSALEGGQYLLDLQEVRVYLEGRLKDPSGILPHCCFQQRPTQIVVNVLIVWSNLEGPFILINGLFVFALFPVCDSKTIVYMDIPGIDLEGTLKGLGGLR